MINRVTITGADRSVHPERLAELSAEYPFVEWGILFSPQPERPRFPGPAWLLELARVKREYDANGPLYPMNLSMHICGGYSRDFLGGGTYFEDTLPINLFSRVQVNANADSGYAVGMMRPTIERLRSKEFIFQYKSINVEMIDQIAKLGLKNISALFDASGGKGVKPGQWLEPLLFMKCGYAGGLGPHNLEEEMKNIDGIVGDIPVWIDMETHVRNGRGPDEISLSKVKAALGIAKDHMAKSGAFICPVE